MPSIQRSALMPFSTDILYDIVNNVVAYPDFLPWCGDAKVISENDSVMEAAILIKKGLLNHWFSTRNELIENKCIKMTLLEGPFKNLQGVWLFHTLDATSAKISLDLSFEFSNTPTSLMLTPVFSQIANTMVDCFCARAYET